MKPDLEGARKRFLFPYHLFFYTSIKPGFWGGKRQSFLAGPEMYQEKSHCPFKCPWSKNGNTIYVARGSPTRMDAAEKVSGN